MNATVLDNQGIGTILDDDTPGQFLFSSANYGVGEGAGAATITVKRVNGNAAGATVQYDTFDGTATGAGNQDYTPVASGILTFGGNSLSQALKIPVTRDTIDEGNETLLLRLSNPQPAAEGAASVHPEHGGSRRSVTTIPGGKISLSSANYSVSEGAGSVKIPVRRSGGRASGVAVHYATSPDTATGGGTDYSDASGDLTFATSGAGAATQTFTVPITQDLLPRRRRDVPGHALAPPPGAASSPRPAWRR